MSPSMNTFSVFTASNKTLAIVPPTSPYLKKYDIGNIHNDIKSMTNKHQSDMKSMNDHITDMRADTNNRISTMLVKLTDTSSKTDKKD